MKFMRSGITIGVLSLFAAALPAADEASEVYATAWCIKADVEPARYLEVAQDLYRKVAAARVGEGNMAGWALWEAHTPAGRDAKCDFAVIHYFQGFPQPIPPLEEALEKAGVSMTAEDYREKRRAISHLVDKELWRGVARIGEIEPDNYVVFSQIKAHDIAGWIDLERSAVRGVVEDLVDEGVLQAWRVAQLVFPSGSQLPYNVARLDVYSDWQAVGAPVIEKAREAFTKAHPDKSWEGFLDRLRDTRDVAHKSVWRVRMVVEAER